MFKLLRKSNKTLNGIKLTSAAKSAVVLRFYLTGRETEKFRKTVLCIKWKRDACNPSAVYIYITKNENNGNAKLWSEIHIWMLGMTENKTSGGNYFLLQLKIRNENFYQSSGICLKLFGLMQMLNFVESERNKILNFVKRRYLKKNYFFFIKHSHIYIYI